MKPILVTRFGAAERTDLRHVCATPRGTLLLAFPNEVCELLPDGTLESRARGYFNDVGTVAEGPDGALYVSDRSGVSVVRGNGIKTIARRYHGNLYRIKFLPNGNMVAFLRNSFGSIIREFRGDAIVATSTFSDHFRYWTNGEQDLIGYETIVIVSNNYTSESHAIEGEVGHRIVGARWPEDETVVSATVFRGGVYHLGTGPYSDGVTLYKNCSPLLRLPDDATQLTSHASSGLYLVHSGKVSKVVVVDWTTRTHHWADDDAKRAIKTAMILRKRNRCPIARLPIDVLYLVFNWIAS